jgi:nicotinate dehydrogenase subunit A
MEQTSLTVNGRRRSITSPGDTPLLYVLRDELGLGGPKFGCGLGQCSACLVLIDDKARHSCQTLLSAVGNAPVTTIEGLGTPEHPHPLQTAFIAEQAAQCGYCTAGMIVASAALLAEKPHPSDTEIVAALDGNLCRCGCQPRVVRAVRRAAGRTA